LIVPSSDTYICWHVIAFPRIHTHPADVRSLHIRLLLSTSCTLLRRNFRFAMLHISAKHMHTHTHTHTHDLDQFEHALNCLRALHTHTSTCACLSHRCWGRPPPPHNQNTFGPTKGQNEQWRAANRRRQRQTIRYRGLVPTPPPRRQVGHPPPRSPPPGTAAKEGEGGLGKWASVQPPPAEQFSSRRVHVQIILHMFPHVIRLWSCMPQRKHARMFVCTHGTRQTTATCSCTACWL
jgi:hypothetical protein